MVMRSRATDGRSASKCQGKWPDQLLTHRFGLSTFGSGPRHPPVLPEHRKSAKIRTGSAVLRGNPGADWELTGTAGLSEVESHGQRSFP
jgi:hypothetical protein